MNLLALNSGSSSLMFGLYRVDSTGAEKLFGDTVATAEYPDAITRVAGVLATSRMPPPDAIGHRIVHGGPALRRHCRVDDAVLRQLRVAAAFAPLHAPAALALIRFAQVHFPGIPQVACFDTQFHNGLPDVASNPVSDGTSRCQVLVLASQEDEQIARHAWALLA